MKYDTLKSILTAAKQDANFKLDFSELKSERLLKIAVANFPDGKLNLTEITAWTEVHEAIEINASGADLPFQGMSITVCFFVKNDTPHFTLKAVTKPNWQLVQSFNQLEHTFATELIFGSADLGQATNSPQFILDSTKGDSENLPEWLFEAPLNLQAMSPDLAILLDRNTQYLTGAIGLQKNGTSIDRLLFNGQVVEQLDFGIAKVNTVIFGIDSYPTYNEFSNLWSVISYLKLSAILNFQIAEEEIKIPISVSVFDLKSSYHFEADINELIGAGWDHIQKIGFGELNIQTLLPQNFELDTVLKLEALYFDLNPSQVNNLIEVVGVHIRSAKMWELFSIGNKPVSIGNILLKVALYNPLKFSDTNASIQINGEIEIGETIIELSAFADSLVFTGNLKEGHALELTELMESFLKDIHLPLPPKFLDITLTDLVVEMDIKNQSFSIATETSMESNFDLAGEPCAFETAVQIAYNANETTKFSGEFRGAFFWKTYGFDVSLKLGEDKAFKAVISELSLKSLLNDLLDIQLPDGIPDLISKELTLSIDSSENFTLKGGFEIKGEKAVIGDTKVSIALFEIDLIKGKDELSVALNFSGAPELSFITDIELKSYKLSFNYERKGEKAAQWNLKGGITVSFFDTHNYTLNAELNSTEKKKTLTLNANCIVSGAPLTKTCFTGITDIDANASEKLWELLKTNGFLDDKGKRTDKFTPWKADFELGLSETYKKNKDAILRVLDDTPSFIDFKTGDQRVITFDPKEISLKWEQITDKEAKKSTWSFAAHSNLSIYAGQEKPVIDLRYGMLRFIYSAAESKSYSLEFTAKSAAVNIFTLNYKDINGVNDKGELITVDKEFSATIDFRSFSIEKTDKWKLKGNAKFELSGIPTVLYKLIGTEESNNGTSKKATVYDLSTEYTGEKFIFKVSGGLNEFIIPDLLAKLAPDSQIIPKVGESLIKLTKFGIEIGQEFNVFAELGIGLPAQLNEVFGLNTKIFKTYIKGNDDSLIKGKLKIGTGGIEGSLANSPFVSVDGIVFNKNKNEYAIDFQKLFGEEDSNNDLGLINIQVPQFSLDLKKGAFKAKGGYKIDEKRGVQIPLKPLHKLLELMQLNNLAKILPPGLPVKSINLDPKNIKLFYENLFANAGLGALPTPLLNILETIGSQLDKFPDEFKKYMSIKIPQELKFAIDVTGDGGVSFNIETGTEPLQLLIPSLTQFTGIRLRKLSFGTALAGNLLKFETDMEIDIFDYPTLLSSVVLLDNEALKKVLPARSEIKRKLIIKDLVVFIIYQSGIPIPIPVFYDKIAINSVGIEGFEMNTALSFPKPKIDFMALIKGAADAKKAFENKTDLPTDNYPIKWGGTEVPNDYEQGMNLAFYAGPFYVRLPKYFGTEINEAGIETGLTFGFQKKHKLLDLVDTTKIFFNGARHIIQEKSLGYFIKAVDLNLRNAKIKMKLMDVLEMNLAWIIATPLEFQKNAHNIIELDDKEAQNVLNILPKTQQKETAKTNPLKTDDTEEDAIDKGAVFFISGSLEIAKALSVKAVGGMALIDGALSAGIQLNGAYGTNILDYSLTGITEISKQGIKLKGNGVINLLGIPIIKGDYYLSKEKLYLNAAIGNSSLPISANGVLEGRFTKSEFYLKGDLSIQLWRFYLKVDALIHFHEKTRVFIFKGVLNLGSDVAFKLDLKVLQEDNNVNAHVYFDGKVLNILHANLNGQLQATGDKVNANGNASLVMLQHEIFKGDFTIIDNIGSFAGKLQLFPINDFIKLDGTINGKLEEDSLNFIADGKFEMGPFKFDSTTTVARVGDNTKFEIAVKNFLGSDSSLILAVTAGSDKRITFKQSTSDAINLFDGALVLSSFANEKEGPAAEMTISTDPFQLETFKLNGALSLFGIAKAKTLVQYQNKVLEFNIKASIQSDFLNVQYDLNTYIDPTIIKAVTNFKAEFNIGKVITSIIEELSHGIVKLPEINLSTGIEIKNFKIEINKTQRKIQADERAEELKKHRAETEKEIKLIWDRMKEASKDGLAQRKIIFERIIAIKMEIANTNDLSEKDYLNELEKLLVGYNTAIKKGDDLQKYASKELTECKNNLLVTKVQKDKTKSILDELNEIFEYTWNEAIRWKEYVDKDWNLEEGKAGWLRAKTRLKTWCLHHFKGGPDGDDNHYIYWVREHTRWSHFGNISNHPWHKQELEKVQAVLRKPWEDNLDNANILYDSAVRNEEGWQLRYNSVIIQLNTLIDKSNAALLVTQSRELMKNEQQMYNEVTFVNEADISKDLGGGNSFNAATVGDYRLSMELELILKLPFINEPIVFQKIAWGTDNMDASYFNKPLLNALPELLFQYFKNNIVGILAKQFHSHLELIPKLIAIYNSKSLSAVSNEVVSEVKVLASILGIEEAAAKLVLDARTYTEVEIPD